MTNKSETTFCFTQEQIKRLNNASKKIAKKRRDYPLDTRKIGGYI